MKLGSVVLGFALALMLALPAAAHTQQYSGTFAGLQESPPNASPGSGSALVTVDFDLLTMRVQASFTGLIGNTTNAHIHCCLPGANGSLNVGVATQTPTFGGFPAGVTSGVYDNTFDMALSSSYNASFVTAAGGTVGGAFNALVAGLDAGNAYFNIHTSSFPGGEIRAALAPVPEPESFAMLGAGLGLLAWRIRRRRGGSGRCSG